LDLLFNDYLLFFFRSEGNLFLIQGGAKSACRKGPVHRAKLKQLSEEEQRAYQSGLAELEAEEMAALGPAFRPSAVGGADYLENLV
jgi:hypothetical protein